MSEKLLVFGASGQLGRAFRSFRPEATYLDRKDADFSHPDRLADILEAHKPTMVINASGYTQVDNAEAEEEVAHIINAESPAAIAIYCAEKNIPFVHFSTDYVFDGSGDKPWKEDDQVRPLNAYGRSKLAGEDNIQQVGAQYLIFRTSWLYDATGRNFVNTMLRLATDREELKIVDDQFGAPTYVPHLAGAVLAALDKAATFKQFPSGIYHICNAGETNWYEFALAIFDEAAKREVQFKLKQVHAVDSNAYPTLARRPKNSRLDNSKFMNMFGLSLPHWREGLEECMDEKFPL